MRRNMRASEGGRIDRSTPLKFHFDGLSLTGFKGDTLASALLANDIHLTGRSFKYHRPRGIVTMGSEEPNALVDLKRSSGQSTPNVRATQIELYDGLQTSSQNRFPSLNFDVGSAVRPFSSLLSAGFYYKTFMWPGKFWEMLYEPIIRRIAGLGRAPVLADDCHYTRQNAHCDILVIGAGPAGLAAALSAARTGARVILCDEQNEFGGSLLGESGPSAVQIDGASAMEYVSAVTSELEAKASHVTLIRRCTAFGYFAHNYVALCERLTDHLAQPDPAMARERLWQIRANQVILATGAIERPLIFAENDRPGIMLADATRQYLTRFRVMAGRKLVVATACDSAYRSAICLKKQGVEIGVIADQRGKAQAGSALQEEAEALGIPIEHNCVVSGTTGRRRIKSALLSRRSEDGDIQPMQEIYCDALAMSGGWTPNICLFSQSRGRPSWNSERGVFLPGTPVQAQFSAGACAGIVGLAETLADGAKSGELAAKAAGFSKRVRGKKFSTTENLGEMTGPLEPEPALNTPSNAMGTKALRARRWAFVDFQNDVTVKDIGLAVREGFHSIEHIKRYTTTGMATDQGKLSNMNALTLAAKHLDRPPADIGLTTFRQPYTPVTFGTLAATSTGDLFEPIRNSSINQWARKSGAVFEDVGQWKRPRYFPRGTEDMTAAVQRECATARRTVGLFDASTLGKIEVVGKDAVEFLNRIYTGSFDRLKIGSCKYSLMLNEAGFVMDDGIVARLGENRFHATTTTGGAARVLSHMEDYLQTEWPDLDVWLTSITEQYSVLAVQGPKARQVIAPLVEEIDLSPDNFRHMSVREGMICGVPTRLMRVSFTGELGYEINIPADKGFEVWKALWAETQSKGGTVYGTETMHVLRAEKGFIIVGQETDGTVVPSDLGMNWAVGKSKTDFVGKRSLTRPDIVAPHRLQLVGLLSEDPTKLLDEGAQITMEENPATGTPAAGHVTSSYHSSALGRSFALALVTAGREHIGKNCYVTSLDKGEKPSIAANLVSPIFYDPEGKKLSGEADGGEENK